jgi:hypothetical protein
VGNVRSTLTFATGNDQFRIDISNISQGVKNAQYKACGSPANSIPGRKRSFNFTTHVHVVCVCARPEQNKPENETTNSSSLKLGDDSSGRDATK